MSDLESDKIIGVRQEMASFRERKLQDGTTSVTALIEVRIPQSSDKFRESRTFDTHKKAARWAKIREEEIREQISVGQTPKKRSDKRKTLRDAIDRYVMEFRGAMGDTKAQVLRTIREECAISNLRCDQITSDDIYNFATEVSEREGVNSRGTVDNYMQNLSSVFSVARTWKFDLDQQAMKDAMKTTKLMGIRGSAQERKRRPTREELDALMQHFETSCAHDPRAVPMHRIVAFAIFSTRRQGEICRITWSDFEASDREHTARVMVRDLKHPGDKLGNDTWCDLPEPCEAIIAGQRREQLQEKRIFPYHPDTVSRRFTMACQFLEIDDLHFHDLRHEGTSRLFEMNWNIPQVSATTGHRSWESLKRYAHIRAKGDIYEGWKWLDSVT